MITTHKKTVSFFAALSLATGSVNAALISYLSLDDATGLTLQGDAAITTGSQGRFGEAISLDGVGDYADVQSGTPVLGGAQRTVAGWVFQSASPAPTGLGHVVSFGDNGANGGKWDFSVDNADGGIEVGVAGGRNTANGIAGLTGRWMFVVSTLPVTSGQITDIYTYLDGLETSTTVSTTNRTVDTLDLAYRIGVNTQGDGGFLNGLIDDIAVWDVALTADEIKGYYDVGNQLSYTADLFESLKDVHDAGSGSVLIGGQTWEYTTGLGNTAGLTDSSTLVLDAAAGTGLVAIPEPKAAILCCLGFLLLLRRRRCR